MHIFSVRPRSSVWVWFALLSLIWLAENNVSRGSTAAVLTVESASDTRLAFQFQANPGWSFFAYTIFMTSDSKDAEPSKGVLPLVNHCLLCLYIYNDSYLCNAI
jgi:hypothetical protein